MLKQVRVRFAPSPTGPLHIGGVRTALFNYLFAKKNNGVFYLRIEDTDQNRFVPGAEEYIFEALEWLGIAPSETVGKNEKFGPYRQSERKSLYKQYADQLVNSGWAYYAFDTAEALDSLRKQYESEGKTFIYNWSNRQKLDTSLAISADETQKRLAAGEDFVIRFKTPVNETLHLHDIIRGDIKFETNLLDDKVLFKSDGMPTYHLANIVDDHLMETSHVIRGEEWLPSMPLHCLLYQAFGWEAPEFAHLPLILKPIGNGKLSKRDGDKMGFPVFPLEWKSEEGISSGYREKGFFPEAVINFLALLGWNDGTDQELFSLEELVGKFDLNRVHKAGAKFDPEKNKWFNHQYLQKQSDESLAFAFEKLLKEKQIPFKNQFYGYKVVNIIDYNLDENYEIKGLLEKPFKRLLFDSNYILSKNNFEIIFREDGENLDSLIKKEFTDKINSLGINDDIKHSFYKLRRVVLDSSLIENNNAIDNTKIIKYDFNSLILDEKNYSIEITSRLVEIVKLIKERANFISDFWNLADYFFIAPTNYDEKAAKNWKEETPNLMRELICKLNEIEDFNSIHIEEKLKNWLNINKAMQPFRLSLVGALKGPHLFDIVELLGKEETIKRLEKAIETL